MFADIILHRRLPSRFETLTYRVPAPMQLEIGQLVEAPFGKRTIRGLVWKLHATAPSFETKELVDASEFVLPEKQRALATWMSAKYACPIHKVIDFFIPERIWKKDEAVPSSPTIRQKARPPALTFIWEKTPLAREKFYKEQMKNLSAQGQLLILFPQRFFAERFAPQGATLFHGELSEKEKAAIWEAVSAGKDRVIVGTRAALFLPFKNLECIVVDFEENENYHEKRAPYYDAQHVALKLAQFYGSSLTYISSAPRVESYYSLKKLSTSVHEHIVLQDETRISLIDMKNERLRGNTSVFSTEVTAKIAAALAQKNQVLLFINRRGQASALICTECHEVVRCGGCSSPFTLHAGEELVCHRCKKSQKLMMNCTHCKSVSLKPLGYGTQGLEKEIKKVFAQAIVVRLDKETIDPRGSWRDDLEKADIIVATQVIDKPLQLPRLKLSIAMNPDPLLNIMDFRATQRVFSLLTHIAHLTRGGELCIQTYLPDHSVFRNLAQKTLEAFYEEELETRKLLGLPPFVS